MITRHARFSSLSCVGYFANSHVLLRVTIYEFIAAIERISEIARVVVKSRNTSRDQTVTSGGGVRVLLRSARRNAAEKRRAHDFSAIPTHAVALTKSTRSFRFNEQFICCLPALLFPPRVRGEHPQPTTTALGTSWRSIASLSKIFCHLSIGRFAGKFSVEKYQQPTWIQLIRQCSLRAYEFYKSLNYSFTIL